MNNLFPSNSNFTDSGKYITISGAFLEKNKTFFERWKRN